MNLNGRRVSGIGLARQMGYPTVNIINSNQVVPGIYLADSDYGRVTIFVLHNNRSECHFWEWNPIIDEQKNLQFYNLVKPKGPKNGIIEIFDKGLKQMS